MTRNDQDFYEGIPRGFKAVDQAVEEVNTWLGAELAIVGDDVTIYETITRLEKLAKDRNLDKALELLRDAKMRRLAHDIQAQGIITLSEKARQKMRATRGGGNTGKLDGQPGKG